MGEQEHNRENGKRRMKSRVICTHYATAINAAVTAFIKI
jgi:hypothetical protein